MQTVIRTTPEGRTQAFAEYSPQEIADARLKREIGGMVKRGYYKSVVGSMRADEFIPDTGARKARH